MTRVGEPADRCVLHGAPPAEVGTNSRGETWVIYFCECRATVLRDLRDPDLDDDRPPKPSLADA